MPADDDEDSTPLWLTPDERRAWLAVAAVSIRLPAALDRQLRRDSGLRLFEYHALAALSEAPGRTRRMSDLADLAQGSPSRLSQVVTRLERAGWVRRAPDPVDRRSTFVTLTDAGWDTVVEAAPAHVAEVRRLVVDPLTAAQRRQVEVIGRRLLAAIDPDDTFLDDRVVEAPAGDPPAC